MREPVDHDGAYHPRRNRVSPPRVSIALPPSKRIVEYAKVAESVGCRRVWVYDSPAVYGDNWVAVARIVESTSEIGVGTGVAVPVLRHPLVTASAIATIEDLSPGRLVAAFGTGFTARRALGQRPMKWADLVLYVRQVRGLLAGEAVAIDGAAAQMLHLPAWGPDRPIATPIWTAPTGPRGLAASRDAAADGVLLVALPKPRDPVFPERAVLVYGTVMEADEDHTSPRVKGAAGPWFVSGYHAVWEHAPAYLEMMPGGAEWRATVDGLRPENERHLAVHEGHVVALTERDLALIERAGEAIVSSGWTGTAGVIANRLDEAGAAGVTEVVYAPAGPDIEAEIRRFSAATSASESHSA
jgi:5,10-methylenetetrahydromethanopterin reductase